MSRYIDADAFMKSIRKIRDMQNFKTNTNWYSAYDEFLDLIEDFPIADVVEIVRCKDCKWFNQIVCKRMNRVMKSDGFCSNGERREDVTQD